LILWQRTQSGLSVISTTHSWGRHPLGFFAYYRIKVPCACAASFIETTLRNPRRFEAASIAGRRKTAHDPLPCREAS
jgi:hypothetical protein